MSRTFKHKKTGGKAVDSHCRNNGYCNACKSNRTISTMRQESNAIELVREYLQNTSKEELEADWAEVKALGLEGPTLTEVLSLNNE